MIKMKLIEDADLLQYPNTGSNIKKHLFSGTSVYHDETDILEFVDFISVTTEEGCDGYINKNKVQQNLEEPQSKILLTNEERGFLITCIMSAASELFQNFPRYKEQYKEESGIKYIKLSNEKIVELLHRLGGDYDDTYELFHYL